MAIVLHPTSRFTVLSVRESIKPTHVVVLELECPYTAARVRSSFEKRPWWTTALSVGDATATAAAAGSAVLQWREFDAMDWNNVLSGGTLGSTYCVRKGLARKA